VCGNKKDPTKQIFFGIVQYLYKILRDYSRHNLPLLLHILSSQLLLFRSSTFFNKNTIFPTVQTNKSDHSQIAGVFCTFDTFEMQKKHQLFVVKTRNINQSSVDVLQYWSKV